MSNWTVNLTKADIVNAFLLLCFSVSGVYITTTWLPPVMPGDPGAAFFPRIALSVIFIFSFVLFVQKIRTRLHDRTTSSAPHITIDLSKFFWTLLFSSLLVAGISTIGFEFSGFLFLFILLWQRTSRWVWAFFMSLSAIAIMYLIFVLILKVRLPLLFLPDYIKFF
ncbi:MAG: tripartite tricarboxylate transporter TctB family protein [Rhodospirillales bacterium]|jgi:hypothetical protein